MRVAFVALGSAALTPCALAQTPSLTLVGNAPNTVVSRITGLSDDGSVAAGYSQRTTGGFYAPGFTWTAAGGRNDFGVSLPSTRSQALGISGNGQTVVGMTYNSTSNRETAYTWTQSGGLRDLGAFNGHQFTKAIDASVDGSVVLGWAESGPGTQQAFIWSEATGMRSLGANEITARAISGNGRVVVGEYAGSGGAYVWREETGVQLLPQLSPWGNSTSAQAVNSDGSIIVGHSGAQVLPTMWIDGTPIAFTSNSPVAGFIPRAVNETGSVVAGLVLGTSNPNYVAVWTQDTGIVPLLDYLADNGVTIPSGLDLFECTSISADGRSFAGTTFGTAFGAQGFVATIPAPGSIVMVSASGMHLWRRRRRA